MAALHGRARAQSYLPAVLPALQEHRLGHPLACARPHSPVPRQNRAHARAPARPQNRRRRLKRVAHGSCLQHICVESTAFNSDRLCLGRMKPMPLPGCNPPSESPK